MIYRIINKIINGLLLDSNKTKYDCEWVTELKVDDSQHLLWWYVDFKK